MIFKNRCVSQLKYNKTQISGGMGLMVNDDHLISNQDAGKKEEAAAENPSDNAMQGREESVGFKELYEQSLQSVQMGGVLTGKVVQINADSVMVDVGWKTEGYIPARELRDDQGNISVNVGDDIEVLVDRRDQDGNLVLSRDKAAKIKIWDDVKVACEQNTPVTGTVITLPS
ncbi:MAG: S1 RNA-binding domain-containing protein, partial [Deltaproteobacteria bacterium]|nr:S1 RNA-binding domain-containing protein [Deltaproteobacteria bacterium]